MSWMTYSPPRSMTSSMIRGRAYESMMWPWSSTISEKDMLTGSLSMVDAVILDVGGVLLVPHHEIAARAFAPFGISVDAETAERAHYCGIHALDAAEDDEDKARRAYIIGYVDAMGISTADRDAALARIREAWRVPNLEVWQQQVRGSAEGLRKLASTGVKLGIVSNADGTIEEQLKRG